MDFRLDDQQLALQDGVRTFCASEYPLDGLGALEVEVDTSGRWADLADLGVFSLMAPEAAGGLGLGVVEAALVFEQLGAHLVPGPILWSTLAAMVLPGDGEHGRVGGIDLVDPRGGTTVEPLVVEHADEIDTLLVLRGDGVFAIDRTELPEARTLDPLDPLTPVGCFDELPIGSPVGGPPEADRLRMMGTVLAAALLLGIADAALEVARDYSLGREQFDRPIGSFQALKHMMADMYVRSCLARSATYAAAAVLDDPLVGHLQRSVAAAKVLAGEAAIENGKAAVQVFGGMGFTWEMPPNYLLKRAWVLEHAFGASRTHALAISASVAGEAP